MKILYNILVVVALMSVSRLVCFAENTAPQVNETEHPDPSPSLKFWYPHDFQGGSFIRINPNQGAALPPGDYFVVDNHVPWLAVIPAAQAANNVKEKDWIWINLLAVP